MFPPAMFTGTLALTASCLALASASGSCLVLDDWSTFCLWPLPPQPNQQLVLPAVCVGVAVCVVVLELDASAVPVLVSVWFAVLAPPRMFPPAMFTGTLALTASCLALASASASCLVLDDWSTF